MTTEPGTPKSNWFTVVFKNCVHKMEYPSPPPQPGDLIWCIRCADYRRVKLVINEWSWACVDCHISRRYGEDSMTARRKFEKHSEKFPRHTVRLLRGTDVIETHEPESGESLFDWIRDNGAEHQKSLKILGQNPCAQPSTQGQ